MIGLIVLIALALVSCTGMSPEAIKRRQDAIKECNAQCSTVNREGDWGPWTQCVCKDEK